MNRLIPIHFLPQRGLLILVLLVLSHFSHSQSTGDTLKRKNTLLAYPLGFYLPETRWGVGAAGSYNFFVDKQDTISPASQLQLGAAITQNKQVLFSLPFAFYWKERTHTLTGEFSYNDYSYYFYGVGGENLSGKKELYKVIYPMFRINYLHKVKRNMYAGLRWWYEDYRIQEPEQSPSLTSGNIPGGNGGVTSGPGVVALYDSRDNVYFTSKGMYLELVYHNQDKLWGSDFRYDRFRFDFRHFLPLRKSLTISNNLFGDFISGNVPFSQMPNIGSAKRMRGFYMGRFRDKEMLLYQGELRGYFYKRFGATAFWNYALLADDVSDFSFNNDHASLGAGLRFAIDRQKKINLRFDAAIPVGVGRNDVVYYFTINEAF